MATSPLRHAGILRGAGAVTLMALLVLALIADLRPGAGSDRPDTGAYAVATPIPEPGLRPGQGIGGDLPPESTVPTLFRVSSFNLLGHGHTAPGGNRPGWASGPTRMRWQVELLQSHDVDVVGFQEFQPEQFREFQNVVGKTWGVYPGAKLARAAMHNSIAWRKDTWRLVQESTLAIPYFGGVKIRMPVILLRNVGTGQQAYFANFHNPANARGDAERWRDQATDLQINLVNRLRAQTGLPVVITGDMNERDEYFCRMTAGAPMLAANGGSNDGAGCLPPSPMQVDWIFGTEEMVFSGYVADRSALVRRSTDHPMVVSDALLPPLTQINGCKRAPLPC